MPGSMTGAWLWYQRFVRIIFDHESIDESFVRKHTGPNSGVILTLNCAWKRPMQMLTAALWKDPRGNAAGRGYSAVPLSLSNFFLHYVLGRPWMRHGTLWRDASGCRYADEIGLVHVPKQSKNPRVCLWRLHRTLFFWTVSDLSRNPKEKRGSLFYCKQTQAPGLAAGPTDVNYHPPVRPLTSRG